MKVLLVAATLSAAALPFLASVTDALGNTVTTEYDAQNRPVRVTHPDGTFTETVYDAAGRRIAVYDALGRLTEERASPSHPSLLLPHAAQRVTHAFDAAGRPCLDRVWNGNGDLLQEESRSYDLRGRLADAAGTYGTLSYAYDEADNLTGVASGNPNGVRLDYTYDALNRLATVNDRAGSARVVCLASRIRACSPIRHAGILAACRDS